MDQRNARAAAMASLIDLQRSAGNRAVAELLKPGSVVGAAGIVQRTYECGPACDCRGGGERDAPLSVQRHPELESTRLSSSPRMVGAHRNSPPLSAADQPQDVALLQSALAEIGFVPGKSQGPFDGFDGIWGTETTKAVRAFQQQNGVRPVGGFEAGTKTLSALDPLLGAGPTPPDQQGDLPQLPDYPEERFEEEPVAAESTAAIPVVASPGADAAQRPVLGGEIGAEPEKCDPPKNDLDEAVRTATTSSPSFARALARVTKRGFKIVHGAPKSSQTNLSMKLIFIACDVSQDEAVIRVIYEVNNADNEVIFQDVRDKSKFKSGEDYAKKVIETESITVMHAARMAEEAGRVYNAKIQSLIRPFLVRSPDGLVFKPGTLDKAHKAVFDQMFQNGKTETGELARDAYKKQWEDAKRLQER
jgi:hypothetical protein